MLDVLNKNVEFVLARQIDNLCIKNNAGHIIGFKAVKEMEANGRTYKTRYYMDWMPIKYFDFDGENTIIYFDENYYTITTDTTIYIHLLHPFEKLVFMLEIRMKVGERNIRKREENLYLITHMRVIRNRSYQSHKKLFNNINFFKLLEKYESYERQKV